MMEPLALYDTFCDIKERKILTFQQHHIPSLRMIGYHNTIHAIAPLETHYHKDCFEFTYMVQGNLSFSVNGIRYPLSGGDMYLTFPNEIHDTGNVPLSLHQMYWFQLEINHPENFLYMREDESKWMIEQLRNLPVRVVKMTGNVEILFRTVFSHLEAETQIGRAQAVSLLEVLLYQIILDAQQSKGRVSSDIGKVTSYIVEHIHERISLEELAQVALLSIPRFKEKFKEEIGTSPRNYINYHKIELAKKLLAKGKNVTEVAMALGFSGSDYFSVVFRRYTSSSPTEYIKQVQENSQNERSITKNESDGVIIKSAPGLKSSPQYETTLSHGSG